MSQNPSAPLRVDRALLQAQMRDLLAYAIETHRSLRANIPVWWRWYRAEPAQATKNTPYQDASNIVYPLIRTHADQLHAQRFQALSPAQDRFWTSKVQNESPAAAALGKEVAGFMNDEASARVFDLSGALYDTLRDSGVVGEGIIRARYAPKERLRFGPPDASGKPTLRTVSVAAGPILEPVPRESVMWQPGKRVDESEWVIREVPYTRQQILSDVREKRWDEEAAKKVLARSPFQTALDQRGSWTGASSLASASRLYAPYPIYEVQVEFPMTAGIQPLEDPLNSKAKWYPPIMIWMDEEANILYCGTYPYPTKNWNYYQLTLSGMGGGNHDSGLAESLEHFQRGVTTMLNQGVDAVSIHNALLFVTSNSKNMGKPWVLGQGMLVDSLDEINFNLRPGATVLPNIQLIQTLFAGAERLTGISDPGFGRESRMGGHPSPATNLMAMLRQGSLKLAATLQRDRVTLSTMATDLAALYQTYGVGDPERLIRRYGAEDAQKILDWANPKGPLVELPDFDVRALDESLNPETEFQKQIMTDQLTGSYLARVLQLLQNIGPAVQQAPHLVEPLGQAIQIATESYRRVLESAQIDDPETFLLRVQGLTEGSAGAFSRMGEAATAALEGLSNRNPGGVVPDLPAGVSGAPPQALS